MQPLQGQSRGNNNLDILIKQLAIHKIGTRKSENDSSERQRKTSTTFNTLPNLAKTPFCLFRPGKVQSRSQRAGLENLGRKLQAAPTAEVHENFIYTLPNGPN